MGLWVGWADGTGVDTTSWSNPDIRTLIGSGDWGIGQLWGPYMPPVTPWDTSRRRGFGMCYGLEVS